MPEEATITGELTCEATGTTFEELLANATEALFSQAVDLETIKERDEHSISIPWQGTNIDVFKDFLKEAFSFLQGGFIARSCEVDIDSDEISVTIRGETLNPSRHTLLSEIKGIKEDETRVQEDMHGTFQAEFSLDV